MRSASSSLRLFSAASGTAMRERLAYLGNYAGSMFTYALFVFIFSRIWASAYAGVSDIAGYSARMAVWYFVVAEMPSFGFGAYFRTLSRDMKSGQVAYLMARPYDFVGYAYAERFGGSLVSAGLILAWGLVVGTVLAGFPPAPPAAWPFVILSLLLSGTLSFFVQLCLAMTAFWLEENDALFWIYQKLSLVVGTLVPLEFLPRAAERIARWTPFPYVAYAPARMAVAFSPREALALLGCQLAWIAAAALAARAVFALGQRRTSVNGG